MQVNEGVGMHLKSYALCVLAAAAMLGGEIQRVE